MKRRARSIRIILFVLCSLGFGNPGFTQSKVERDGNEKAFLKLINSQLGKSAKQYRYFATQANPLLFPKTLNKNGELESSKSSWWCSGFYPGTLLYLCKYKMNDRFYHEAMNRLTLLEPEKNNKTTHDLGFMMYCSFGNALKIKPDEKFKDILVSSAKSLASRFSPAVGCIRSWDFTKPEEFAVIIDNMLNLELLFYATKVTGDSSFYKIAVSHADKTMENHFRPDYSCFHVVTYNYDGTIMKKHTHQGYSDSSEWARGQGWALYGYTLMYRETKDKKYLEQANHIARYILNHPNLPADKIPYWDFKAPNIPDAYRDASAAAVIASGLIELAGYNGTSLNRQYLDAAKTMIINLSGSHYFTKYKEAKGFLLKHSVGSIPHNSEIDVPLSYADYYYVEALIRYKMLLEKNQLTSVL